MSDGSGVSGVSGGRDDHLQGQWRSPWLGTRRRPAAGARREYLLTLLAGAVGAAVVLLAARQGWARVVTVEPRPLPTSRIAVRGQDPGARGGRAGAGRAGSHLAAVLATRRLARRVVGGLLALFGVAIVAVL